MHRFVPVFAIVLLTQTSALPVVAVESNLSLSPGQQILNTAAAEHKYTFLVFYRDNSPATQAMAQTVKRGVEARGDRATATYIQVTNAAEKALVDRFDVSRAPMPLTVAVAPNGAMTALTPKTITDEQIEKAFVTPAMSHCMKFMQEGRMVFLCVQSKPEVSVPAGVQDFVKDPEFAARSAVVIVRTTDPNEARLVKDLESDVPVKGQVSVLLAPPGVLVGKFLPATSKEQIAVALHKAGKCCDDPNCKHNR